MNAVNLLSTGMLAGFGLLIGALLFSDVAYLAFKGTSWQDVWQILISPDVINALKLSLVTSLITLVLVLATAIPIGYAVSRFRFPGHTVFNTIIDVPIVLPPVVIGISLLAFFGSPIGQGLKGMMRSMDLDIVSPIGIVVCQYLVSISYCIRTNVAAFDSVDPNLEEVALTLGCTPWQTFAKVTIPLAKNGLVAGGIIAWARAIGVFGPLMVFIGTGPRVQVMPTTMWLELSIGNIEVSLIVALISVTLAGIALTAVHHIAPGRIWS